MGGVVKKWKMGGVFCKKSGPFLNAGCIMYSISIFFILHFTYLGVRTHPTDPPAYGPAYVAYLLYCILYVCERIE